MGLPMCMPLALALAIPDLMRLRIIFSSSSANTPAIFRKASVMGSMSPFLQSMVILPIISSLIALACTWSIMSHSCFVLRLSLLTSVVTMVSPCFTVLNSCKSQVWVPKAHEHKHNLDYLIEAGPCNKCQVPSCEYRHLNPYPETAQGSAAEHRHEVKTNPATHTYTTTGAIKDDGKRFAPTGNLFLEIWQNVKLAKGQKHKPGATYRGKEGWLYQEPLAEWYHFYQPVTTTRRGEKISIIEPEVYEKEIRATLTQDKHEPDEAFDERVEAEYQKQLKLSRRERAKEARRFAKEMTVNDRLIYCRPWPYIVSINGCWAWPSVPPAFFIFIVYLIG